MIFIEHSYIRATIPGVLIASAYMEIENKGDKTVTLLGVSSKISPQIEIHQHTMVDGIMRMRQLNSIDIKSKERVKLQPSGLHLMLFEVENPLVPQQEVELTLHFSNDMSVITQVPIYSPIQEKSAQKSVTEMHKHHH